MAEADPIIAIEGRLSRLEELVAGLNPAERRLLGDAPLCAIVSDVAFLTGLRGRDILSERRFQTLFRARCAIAWTVKRTTEYSLPRIGRFMGGLDHTSVMNQLRRAEQMRVKDPAFRDLTDRAVALAIARRAALYGGEKSS